MAAPKLVEAEWAKGKFDTYRLCRDGSFVGYMHPPGVAFLADTNPNSQVDVDMVFLSARNQQFRGQYHICAASTVPFASHEPGSTITCELILLLGVSSSNTRPPRIKFHYYRWKNNLGKHNSLSEAMIACRSPFKFIKAMFDKTITTTDQDKQWKHKFERASLYGSLWQHETGPGPNKWMMSGNVYPSDSKIKIIKGVQATSNRNGFYTMQTVTCGNSTTDQ